MFQLIEDIVCNKCEGIYKSDEGVMSVLYHNCYFSICPKCTDEIATMMGLTKETLNKKMGLIRKAETENNRKYDIEHGHACAKCEKRFKFEGEARVTHSNASNMKNYHLDCYGV